MLDVISSQSRYGRDEACAMCLLLALNNSTNAPLTSQLARWVSAFGGEPIAIDTNSTPAVQGLTATAQGQAIRAPAPRFSGRHGGICRVIYGLLKQIRTCILRDILVIDILFTRETKITVECCL